MEVTIKTGNRNLSLDSEALDVAVFLANVFGYELDLEPNGNSFSITATHYRTPNRIIATGKTVKAVSQRFIELLTNEVQDD